MQPMWELIPETRGMSDWHSRSITTVTDVSFTFSHYWSFVFAVISGCWNSLAVVYLVWFRQATQLQTLLATPTPSGCSTHHRS